MATKLILLRHGITGWNQQRRYCGRKDVALSVAGKIQAAKLRQRLKAIKFDRIYCSDRKRALQTCRIIFDRAKITRVSGLREMDFGVFEGMRHQEIMKKYPDACKKWLSDPAKYSIPRSESLSTFKKRVNRAIKNIARLNPSKTVAIVCHGGTIGVFITGILKAKNFWSHIPRAASVTIVECQNGRLKIKLFGCVKHLKGRR